MTATTKLNPSLTFALLLTLIPASLHASPKIFFANDYGAKGDGTTLNTRRHPKSHRRSSKRRQHHHPQARHLPNRLPLPQIRRHPRRP